MCRDGPSLFVVALIIIVCVGPLSASGPNPGSEKVFRSSVELVALNVVVTDARQQYVRDLREHDFVILEDGVRQPISFFAAGQVPLDLVLLIDTSSSMGPLRPTVQRAASGFLGVLKAEDRCAVVGFNQTVTVLQDLTGDRQALADAIRRAGASGDTSLYTAIYVALRQFGQPARQAGDVRRQAIVVLTDGEENASGLGFDALQEEALSRGVAIYAIMLQTASLLQHERVAGRLTPTRAAVKQLALESGAAAYFPRLASELGDTYARIAAELTNQYSIAYLPTTAGVDRTPHRIAIRIAAQPGLRARTRTHYLPSGATLKMAAAR